MGKIQGYMYTSIYYCCKSFPLLLHDVMAGGWNRRPGAVDCTIWNECHRIPLACRRPGAGAHRDIERGKVSRATRVACIAWSACTSLDLNSNK